MNKRIIPGILLASLMFATACTSSPATPQQSPAAADTGSAAQTEAATTQSASAPAATNPASSGAAITGEEAQQIALQHAGVASEEVTFIHAHPDYDDGRNVYEVEFYKGNEEFDYEIDANTGDILSFDYDVENFSIPGAAAPASSTPAEQTATDAAISEDDAKRIALETAQVAESDTSFLSVHYEFDDGRATYQVHFVVDTTEYEFEIDANTGDVIEYDAESVYD